MSDWGRLACVAAVVVSVSASPVHAQTRGRLTLHGVPVPDGQFLTEFHVDTWGVDILAVCHVPADWKISVQEYEDSQGLLSGTTTHFHGALDRAGERALTSVFLVDVMEDRRRCSMLAATMKSRLS